LTTTTVSLTIILRPPPSSTLFPYTTLFRSEDGELAAEHRLRIEHRDVPGEHAAGEPGDQRAQQPGDDALAYHVDARHGGADGIRSEEHTSELQSRFDLVCRLLLEKKKQKDI